MEDISPRELEAAELRAASGQVPSRDVLWDHFLRELGRLGHAHISEGQVHLLVDGETAPHRFVATADSLRRAIVGGHALSMRHRPDVPPLQKLPVWFLLDLAEDIGSHESPTAEPYVHVSQIGELHRSVHPEWAPMLAPLVPPSEDDAVPGGHWSDSHGNSYATEDDK